MEDKESPFNTILIVYFLETRLFTGKFFYGGRVLSIQGAYT